MRFKLILPFVLFAANCFSQEHLINGTVYSGDKHQPVSKVKVTLHLPDSKTMEVTTDSTGTYFFKAAGPGKFFITAEKCIKGSCATGECFLDKKFVIDPEALKHDNSIFCDLTLMPIRSELLLPAIYFKKNSFVPDSAASNFKPSIDSALYCVAELLLLNPTMKININGYSEKDEGEFEKLSIARAIAVKKRLVKYNVDEKRLLIKGFGTKYEKEQGLNNKLVTFSVIQF